MQENNYVTGGCGVGGRKTSFHSIRKAWATEAKLPKVCSERKAI